MPVRLLARLAATAALALLAVVVTAVTGTPARAALLPPSVTTQTAYAPPSGIARFDFAEGSAPDVPAAIVAADGRTYTVGETRGPDGNTNIAVVARRRDGSLDPGFDGDGRRSINLLAGSTGVDRANGAVVLPDGRLRIAGTTDADASTSVENLDAVIVGLRPDGSFDPSFGGGDGIVTFAETTDNEILTDLALAPSGRLAVVGSRASGGQSDSLVSLREADGSPVTGFATNGVSVFDRSGGLFDDSAVDVALRPGGEPVALLHVDTNARLSADGDRAVLRAFAADGSPAAGFGTAGEVALDVGQPDTVPSALIAHGGRLYATGRTRPTAGSTDFDGFLARVDGDGGGQQSRRFDLRGQLVPADQAVLTDGLDLAVVPGVPTSLAIVGSTQYTFNGDRRTDWAAAVFNGFEGDLATAGFGEIALETPNRENRLTALVADGPNAFAVAGPLDAEPRGNSVTIDTSFGNARLLIDAEKRCDLALRFTDPLELVFSGRAGSNVSLEVRHVGTRPCGGTVEVPAPFAASHQGRSGPIATGMLTPGDVFTARGVDVAYTGPRPLRQALLRGTVTVTDDTDEDPADNARSLLARFSYCDVAVSPRGPVDELPNEGAARLELRMTNTGTIPCRDVSIGVTGTARLLDPFAPFALTPGRSASDRLPVAPVGEAAVGRSVPYTIGLATTSEDIEPGNDALASTARVVAVGDTTIRRAGARSFSGTARSGRGSARPRSTRVSRVEVAIQRLGGRRCRFVSGRGGRVATFPREGRRCAPVWLRASGKNRWRLSLRRSLPAGRYAVLSRAVTRNGFAEARFGRGDGNHRTIRVR